MENSLKLLQDFLNIEGVSINNFYSVNIWSDSVKLQGSFTTDLAQFYSKLKFEFVFNDHLKGKSTLYPQIEICLT